MTYSKKKKATSHANCVSLITEERAREIVDKRDREANALFNVINRTQQVTIYICRTEKNSNTLANVENNIYICIASERACKKCFGKLLITFLLKYLHY